MNELDLTEIQEYIEQGADFIAEQAPLVAQEVLFIGRLQYTGGACVTIAACFILVVVCRRLVMTMVRGNMVCDEAAYMLGVLLSGIGAFVTSSVGINATLAALTAWFAPRVYILEQLKGLL